MYRGQSGNIGTDVRVKIFNKMVNITKIVLYFFMRSLLREHTLDGSGWAPTRKLKVSLRWHCQC